MPDDKPVSKWIGRVVEMIDGCDNWKPHRLDQSHSKCVTCKYKVRLIELDEDGEYYWARPAG